MSRFPAVALLMASVLATSVGCGALGQLCRYHDSYPGDSCGAPSGGCSHGGGEHIGSVPPDDLACCETDGGDCGQCTRQHCCLLDWSCAVIRWPLAVAHKLVSCLLCTQYGCGEVYWNEFTSDPPDECDSCDRYGRWTGPARPYRAPYRITPYASNDANPMPPPAPTDQWDPWQEDFEDFELVSAAAPLPSREVR